MQVLIIGIVIYQFVLKNRFEKSTFILKDVDGLEWIQL